MKNGSTQAQSGMRMIVTGGGTGGHLFPGIAVAEAVLGRFAGSKVLFVGTERLIDQKALANRRFEVTSIRSRGLKGKRLLAKLGGLLQVPFSIIAAIRVIIKFKPEIVFGVGGYVTGPVVLAASLLGVATAIHEQNSVPGLANRLLGRFAQRVLLSIPGSEKYFPAKKCLLSGNPVRSELLVKGEQAVSGRDLSNTLLVLGGSQGAHRVNGLVVEAIELAASELPSDFSIIHQTGLSDEKWVRERYESIGVTAQVAPFFNEMADLYSAAGLVISRAGATSLAEMAVFGLPSILIPYPFAADDHQEGNASFLVEAGGAMVRRESELDGAGLAKELVTLLNNKEERLRMGSMARKLSLPQATETIVDELVALVSANG